MITHVVLFRPRPNITQAEKQELAAAVRQTCTEAPTVRRFELSRVIDTGAGYSQKFGALTYEYVAVIEFDDREGLLAYFRHPSHDRLAKLFWEACEATSIIDSETLTDVL